MSPFIFNHGDSHACISSLSTTVTMNIPVEQHSRPFHENCNQQLCCDNVTPLSMKSTPLDPKWRALELYTQMFHACFLPATTETLRLRTGDLRNKRLSIAECIRKRELLQAPATDLHKAINGWRTEKNFNRVLEYGLRCASPPFALVDASTFSSSCNRLYSGIDKNIPMNHCHALQLFADVATFCPHGGYAISHRQSVIAASCYLYIIMLQQRNTEDELPGVLCGCEAMIQALIYLAETCKYGMFTYSSLWMWLWLSSPPGPSKVSAIPDLMMELYMDEWDIFRVETGVQPLGATCCAYCQRKGVRHRRQRKSYKARTLRQCAGGCIRDKKPLYCSKQCQAMVSSLVVKAPTIQYSIPYI